MTKNKENYFKARNFALLNRDDRKDLGEREVLTFLTMVGSYELGMDLSGKKVLDLGCGDQYPRKAFEKFGASYRGIDIDECDLESQDIPVENESADIVVSLALLEHLFDPGHFFSEVLRVLKPGGIFWVSTPDIASCGPSFWNDPTHVHPYTRVSLRKVLEMNGFGVIAITPNYRCKPKSYYGGSGFDFFRARFLMPLTGTSTVPLPSWFKGKCTGIFALAIKEK